ncbi:MAG: HEAT repeat domain-containing protein [Planctomycetota bacterium]|jgi:hypothetical protein
MLRLVHRIGALCLLAVLIAAGAGAAEAESPEAAEKKRPAPTIGDLPRLVEELAQEKDLVKAVAAREDLLVLLEGDDAGDVMTALEDNLERGDRKMKTAVIQCLAASGHPEAAELVLDCLDDEDKWVKLCALAALRKMDVKEDEFLAEVRDLVDEDDDLLRKEAMLALGHLKDPAATDLLIDIMEGPDQGMRENAQWALEKSTGLKLGSKTGRWRVWQAARDQLREHEEKCEAAEIVAMREAVRDQAVGKKEEEGVDSGAVRGVLSATGLVLIVLLGASIWLVMPSWLNAKISAQERRAASGSTIAMGDLAMRFRASDMLPDFVVYPFLHRTIRKGSRVQREIGLRLLELRAFGGCRRLLGGGNGGRGVRVTHAGREWVSKLPRSLLEDLAILRGPGKNLVRALDPDNPRWKRTPTRDEERRAKRSYLSWLAKSN